MKLKSLTMNGVYIEHGDVSPKDGNEEWNNYGSNLLEMFSSLEKLELVLVLNTVNFADYFDGDFLIELFEKLKEKSKTKSLTLDNKFMFKIPEELFADVTLGLTKVNFSDSTVQNKQMGALVRFK